MNHFKLFIAVLIIPIVGLFVSEGIQSKLNFELRESFHSQYPDASPEEIAKMSVDRLCDHPIPEISELCRTNRILNMISVFSFGTGILGIVLIGGIWFAGRRAQGYRESLLKIFKPSMYLVLACLSLLIILSGAIAVGSLYYGQVFVLGRVYIYVVTIVGIAAALGAGAIVKQSFNIVKKVSTSVVGVAVTEESSPRLWQLVREVAAKIGSLQPEQIVVGIEPNFFVTEAEVTCLSGKFTSRTLYCSLSLARILTIPEFTSIIGHELGHFKGLDTRYSKDFYPIYRGTINAIASLEETGGNGFASIALAPATMVLTYFFDCFATAETKIARERELLADQQGVNVSSSIDAGAALGKVDAFAWIWNELVRNNIDRLPRGQADSNLSVAFAERVARERKVEVLEGIGWAKTIHPTDSHPPLGVRLKDMSVSLEELSDRILDVVPTEPAISLFSDAELKERELTESLLAPYSQRIAGNPP